MKEENHVKRLDQKTSIITGAARGQGAAEARLFAAEGAKVVITDVNDSDGREIARQIGGNAVFVHHDVTDEASWKAVIAATLEAFGTVDILVNNAGVYKPKTFQETDARLLDFHYRVNVLGTFLGMQAVYPVMLKAGGGAIVNVASGAGMRGYPSLFAYAGSKWMVRGLSKCAAVDLAASHIRVNTIIPGLIDTPMLGENSPGYLDTLTALVPAGRLGTVGEIAEAALYLASDAASYVSGAELAVCGALMA
jgi:3alpha(or 20beta)-hydroxysteroid dehydrogenase